MAVIAQAVAAGQQRTFPAPHIDVLKDVLLGGPVDHRSHKIGAIFRGTDLDLFREVYYQVHQPVVDLLMHDQAGTGGAFLALETEGGGHNTLGGAVKVGVPVYDDGVFATHFDYHPLDPDLSRSNLGGPLVYAQTDLHTAGKSDEAYLGVIDDGVPDFVATAGKIGEHPGGQARLLHHLGEYLTGQGGVAGGLEHHTVSGNDGGASHSGKNCQGNIPRGNHCPQA